MLYQIGAVDNERRNSGSRTGTSSAADEQREPSSPRLCIGKLGLMQGVGVEHILWAFHSSTPHFLLEQCLQAVRTAT